MSDKIITRGSFAHFGDELGVSLKKADGSIDAFVVHQQPRKYCINQYSPDIHVTGAIHITVHNEHGDLVQELVNPNLVVTVGKGAMASLMKSVQYSSNLTVAGTSSASGLIQIQTSAAHGLYTGQDVVLFNVGGTTEANGNWTITVVDTTHFTLVGSTYTNAWTSGGSVWCGPAEFQWMALGTGTSGPTSGDTRMGSEISTGLPGSGTQRVAATRTNPTSTSILYSATWNPGVATNTAITEAGIFNSIVEGSTLDTMLARSVFGAINKGSGDTLSLAWTITIS